MTHQDLQNRIAHLRLCLARELPRQDRIACLNELAWLERDFDIATSLALCEQAYALAGSGAFESGTPDGLIQALRTRGVLRMWQGLNKESIEDSLRALELLEIAPDAKLEIQVRCNLTYAFLGMSNLEQATQSALTALEMANALRHQELQEYAFDALCGLYARVEDWAEALNSALRAQELANACGNFRGATYILNNLAWIQLQRGNYPAALQAVDSCIERAKGAGFRILYVAALGTAGEIYLAQQDYARAITVCTLFMEQAERDGLQNESVYARQYLGKALWHSGETERARRVLDEALTLATNAGMLLEQSQCNEMLAKVFELQNDFQSALGHYKAFQEFREQVIYKSSRQVLRLDLLERLKAAQHALDAKHRETEHLHAVLQEHKRERETLYELATHDALTNILNRRHFDEMAERYLQTRSTTDCVALILFDIDYFKQVNDKFGHAAGDAALQTVVQRVREHLRAHDLFGRLGGDEFILLLPNICGAEARAVAERLRYAIATHTVLFEGAFLHLSLSLGISYCLDQELCALQDLVRSADQALYQAKQRGRNQSVMSRFSTAHQ